MKVCQLCNVDFFLKKFLLPLVDGMVEAGWEVTSVCSDGHYVQGMRADGYRVHTVPIARSMNPWLALRSVWALARYFKRERFDVVHTHTPVAALIGRLAARIAGVPLVVNTAHGFYFHDEMPPWKRRVFVGLERFGGRFTDLLFCQSNEDADDAVVEGISPADRTVAIGNGVNVSAFDPARVRDALSVRAELGIPSEAYVVGLVGRLVREKGVAEFLKAATVLAPEYPDLYVLLIGERLASDHAAGIDEEFADAKRVLGLRLVAPGLRNDIPDLVGAMDVFCLPSWREGMPRTIIEAMMMAKPVVATRIRGSREEVVHEETGLLVPLKSTTDLAAAIGRLAADPQWGRGLGLAGRERALSIYDEQKVVALQIERIRHESKVRGLNRQVL